MASEMMNRRRAPGKCRENKRRADVSVAVKRRETPYVIRTAAKLLGQIGKRWEQAKSSLRLSLEKNALIRSPMRQKHLSGTGKAYQGERIMFRCS